MQAFENDVTNMLNTLIMEQAHLTPQSQFEKEVLSQRNNLDYNQDVKQGSTNISIANKLNMLSQILQMGPSKRQSIKATPAPSNI